jgi:hypothetical protein
MCRCQNYVQVSCQQKPVLNGPKLSRFGDLDEAGDKFGHALTNCVTTGYFGTLDRLNDCGLRDQ